MANSSTASVEVDIFGSSYYVRGHGDAEHLRELADVVDEKMKEIASHVTTVDTAKIAVLAALNLAEELQELKISKSGTRQELTEEINGLADDLESVVSD